MSQSTPGTGRKHTHTFKPFTEQQICNFLNGRYPELAEFTPNDLRAIDGRQWQAILYVILKHCPWMNLDDKDFGTILRNYEPRKRNYLIFLMLKNAWLQIGNIAHFRLPQGLDLKDVTRPVKDRVMHILSGFMNADLFLSSLETKDEQQKVFTGIVQEMNDTRERTESLQKSLELLEAMSEIECQNAQCQREIDQLEAELRSDQAEQGPVEQEIDRLSNYIVSDIDAFMQQPRQLQEKVASAQAEADEAEKRDNDMRALTEYYRDLASETKTAAGFVVRAINGTKTLEELRTELANSDEVLEELIVEQRKLVDDITHLHNDLAKYQSQQAVRTSRVSTGSAEIGDENDEFEEKEVQPRREERDALRAIYDDRRRALVGQLYPIRDEFNRQFIARRDALAENHDAFMDYNRRILNRLSELGLMKAIE